MSKQYPTFREFYPFYLGEHSNRTCKLLHFIGTWVALGMFVSAAVTGNAWWVLGAFVAGYAFAWVGHFFFEKNRPATFTYPLYSFMGDWVMWKDIMIGKVRL
ncbi:MAG TPA: DUF962 domain-containing protein [Xanthomonadales bacterium]|nr:DUF962 domain-containing protein [Xanthomonadales bacterium]